MSIERNTLIDHYRILEPIGAGAFSTVYRGRDDRLDAEVAIKVLAENRALDPDARARFVDEARLVRKVNSRTIVQIHDLGETAGGQPYLVMELADRDDLLARVARRAPGGVPPDGIRPVVEMLAAALTDLHQAGLVHRDVKPSNILIASQRSNGSGGGFLFDRDERLLLTDLGFVKDLSLASGLTSGGGTRWFQAPEQRERVSVVDHRADLFAASAVVAWLSTGTVPADDADWRRHLERFAVEPRLRNVIEQGLADDPEHRPATVEAWQRPMLDALSSPPAINPTTTQDVRHRRRIPRIAVTTALAVALGVGAAGGFLAAALIGDDGGPGITETIADDRLTVELQTPYGRLAIDGPRELVVGRPATFNATAPEGTNLFWVGLGGGRQPADEPLEVVASSPGSVPINLAGVIDGRAYALSHEFSAVADG